MLVSSVPGRFLALFSTLLEIVLGNLASTSSRFRPSGQWLSPVFDVNFGFDSTGPKHRCATSWHDFGFPLWHRGFCSQINKPPPPPIASDGSRAMSDPFSHSQMLLNLSTGVPLGTSLVWPLPATSPTTPCLASRVYISNTFSAQGTWRWFSQPAAAANPSNPKMPQLCLNFRRVNIVLNPPVRTTMTSESVSVQKEPIANTHMLSRERRRSGFDIKPPPIRLLNPAAFVSKLGCRIAYDWTTSFGGTPQSTSARFHARFHSNLPLLVRITSRRSSASLTGCRSVCICIGTNVNHLRMVGYSQ